jgi:hypothetical protein
MENILIAITILSLFIVIVAFVQIIRLEHLSDTLDVIINETHEKRKLAIKNPDIFDFTKFPYPDVGATYNNLKWYTPWKSSSSMIVYNKGF